MRVLTLTASEFQNRAGDALDRSLTHHVVVTKHGRPRNVVISFEEYERFMARDRRVVTLADWNDEDITALEAARMDAGLKPLDAELDEE
jgi:prevent-host-death family protein